MEEVNFVVRWGHLVFGITWVGMLYYFNFVQGSYFKSASPEGLIDAKAKLAPNALWCCLLYTSPSPRDKRQSRMPSSA